MKRNRAAIAINGLVISFSSDWARLKAVDVLCREAYPECEVVGASTQEALMRLLTRLKPQCLIMDLTARNAVGLLCSVRRLHRTVPVLLIQDQVRVSDEAVADYLGRAVMVESGGIVPDILRQRLSDGFVRAAALPVTGGSLCESSDTVPDMDTVLAEIEAFLCQQLAARVPSSRLREDIWRLFVTGESVKQLSRREGLRTQTIYQRRATLCRLLGTRPRDLSSVLTVAWGETIRPGVSASAEHIRAGYYHG